MDVRGGKCSNARVEEQFIVDIRVGHIPSELIRTMAELAVTYCDACPVQAECGRLGEALSAQIGADTIVLAGSKPYRNGKIIEGERLAEFNMLKLIMARENHV